MDYKALLSEMLRRSHNTKKGLARKVGMSASGMSMLWRREGLRVRTLLKLSRACGYEVVVRPQNYVRLMEEELLLDAENDEVGE